MEIKVYKTKKILEKWDEDQLTKTYPIGVGKSLLGHKEQEGDMRTPEGQYAVCIKNPLSQYHLSFAINYPNKIDALLGLQKGFISEDEYYMICTAHDNHEVPPQKTALGGEIYIHGELEKKSWSQGCIRMYNKDIDELYPLVEIGTKVTIYP
jgi:murein L,D-transpeptidase YafK